MDFRSPVGLQNNCPRKRMGSFAVFTKRAWIFGLALCLSPSSLIMAECTPGAPASSKQPQIPGAIHTLKQALEATYANNTELKELRFQVQAADEKVPQALAGWRPSVSLNTSITGDKKIISGSTKEDGDGGIAPRSSGVNSTLTSAAIQLQQNIFNGGKTLAQTKGADENVKAARAALADKEREVFLATVKAFFNVIQQAATVELRKSNETSLNKSLEAANDKFNVGEETKTAISQASADLADARAQLQTAEADLLSAKATFHRVVGAPAGNLETSNHLSQLPENLQNAIEIAQKNNPAILQAIFVEKASRQDIKANDADLLPKLDLQASTTRNSTLSRTNYSGNFFTATPRSQDRDYNTDHNVQVQLQIPLYERGAVRGRTRELRELAEQNRIKIETARRKVIEDLISNWEIYHGSKASVKNYQDQVKDREVALDGTQQEMLVGSKILLDVLFAQRDLVTSQLKLVQEEYRLYTSAYSILAAMGRLNSQDMKLTVKQYDPTAHYREVRNSW